MGALTKEAIKVRVREILIHEADLNEGDVTDDTTFAELGIDSMLAIEIAIRLEDEFGVNIPEADDGRVNSVDGAVAVFAEVLGV